ncbi:hypothetical protein T484DRAFT_1784516 [Baffinella frigidus]|nr:hypothetical protein T484DRAFT_1784516 [Cryptophyta sp. CCMP2293]
MSAVDGPGLRSVVFLQGCNLNCGHCHNPSTIPRDAADASWETASSLGYQLLPYSPFLSGITISGGEPTLQAAFVADFGAWMREQPQFARATLAVDSNGAASRDTWRTLLPVIDGAFISLKAGTEEGYRDIAGAAVMESVAQSLQLLYDAGKLWEVRIVVLPGVNDSQGQLLGSVSG